MSPDKISTDQIDGTSGDDVDKQDVSANNGKLIALDNHQSENSGSDINSKITALDTDLAHLRMELGSINNSVEEGLDRLSDTDTDLTAKVSETYKRLGEIDNAYKSLIEISSRIDRDIQKLNGDVSEVAEQSASGIKNLEQSTVAQSNELAHKNQQVASRVSQLVETSKLSNDLLGQKIKTTTEAMMQIEKRVVADIENLSTSTSDKASTLENAIDGNKAKILKLQSVDEAIIRRATTLEISSAELTAASQRIDSSVEQLELNSDTLAHGVEKLKQRTADLEALTSDQGTLISGLKKTTAEISGRVATLAGREQKHFNIMTAGFLLLLIATAVIYFAQQDQFMINDSNIAERSEEVDSMVFNLQQAQLDADKNTSESLAALEDKISQVNNQVDEKMLDMQDHVQSVEGRLNESSPFSQIGDDNILHGEQWITKLPAQNFTVQLAFTDSRNTLYEIAQRYNHYLKDTLSYFTVETNGVTKYALLSGSYVSQQQAQDAVGAMPHYIDMQQPVIRKLGLIQDFIKK